MEPLKVFSFSDKVRAIHSVDIVLEKASGIALMRRALMFSHGFLKHGEQIIRKSGVVISILVA
jgi:hypothetical protein